MTRESREFKEKATLLEEDVRITNKQLERANSQIQRLERDLDEVRPSSWGIGVGLQWTLVNNMEIEAPESVSPSRCPY